MPKLKPSERRALPPSAFAYIDSQGEPRLPIHDEKHVRNALARFGRVVFESDAARERARTRLLTAAKRHGIMPLGFITSRAKRPRHGYAAGTSRSCWPTSRRPRTSCSGSELTTPR